MGFAELPKELLQAILNHAIIVRGIKRGLRLRLLNRRFAAEVIDTIYNYRMLDGRFSQRLGQWQGTPMPPFTASYVEYRIHNAEHDPAPYPRLGFLRKTARDVVAENESLDYDACVNLLCRLISEGGAERVYQVFCPALSLPTTFYEGDGDYVDTLFATAVVTNTTPIVQRYVETYHHGTKFKSLLAPSAHDFYRLAARYAEPATLGLLLSTEYSNGVDTRRHDEMLVAAAAVGRLSAFRLIHELRIEKELWDFRDRQKRYVSQRVFEDARGTPSIEVWQEVVDLKATYGFPSASAMLYDRKTRLLADCVREGGDAGLVEHLLDLGADIDGIDLVGLPIQKDTPSPLLEACANGYEDLVRILISRGATTSPSRGMCSAVAVAAAHGQTDIVRLLLKHGATPFGGLLRAARAGYMDIARMLLDAGVDAGENDHHRVMTPGLGSILSETYPIACAIAIEHVDMAMLLKVKGARVSGSAGTACLRVAKKEGLESMLSLLDEWDVDERG